MSSPLRIASVLCWLTAIGFGPLCVPAIRSVMQGRGVPMVYGFPAYGNGPFERVGIRTTAPLLAGFLLVCTLEGIAGWLLWSGQWRGAILSLILLPFGAVYWWGFALPFPPIFALARTVLVIVAWRSLES